MEPSSKEPVLAEESSIQPKTGQPWLVWILCAIIPAGAAFFALNLGEEPTQEVAVEPTPAIATTSTNTITAASLFADSSDAIVKVINPATGEKGTGFFIKTSKGYAVLTTCLLTEPATCMLVVKEGTAAHRNPQAWVLTQIVRSPESNLALLNLEETTNPPVKALALKNSKGLTPGAKIFSIGYPQGRTLAIQEGTLNSIDEQTLHVSRQAAKTGGGSPIISDTGDTIGILVTIPGDDSSAEIAMQTTALPHQAWKREDGTAPDMELAGIERLATSWQQMDVRFDANLQQHSSKFSPEARQLIKLEEALDSNIVSLSSAEKEIPWKTLSTAGDEETKIRKLDAFVKTANNVAALAANCMNLEGERVTKKTLNALNFAQSARDLGTHGMKLVAQTANDTADQELKDAFGNFAQTYFQNKKLHEQTWK